MKKLIPLFILITVAFTTWAYDFSAVAPTGQTLYYTISGSNAIVTWPGSYYPYGIGYTKPTGSLTIPLSVTYSGSTYSVTSIDFDAFAGCSGLTSVTIPNSVTSIGSFAFDGCSGLTSVTIPNSVTSIGGEAFFDCSGLTSITIPNSVTSIGEGVFFNCSGLTSVTIPNSVTSIGRHAFYNCSGLTSITIPNSVTSIGGEAFYGCSSLTSITVDANNAYYDSRNNCNAIINTATNTLIQGCQSTIIPNSVTSIGNFAFTNCSSLTSVTIPNSVTSIGAYAFAGCSGLTSITIPNSVTSIGYEAFYNCSSLTSITIPNSVTSIGEVAFYNCSGLTSVTIPNSVTSIGSYAFAGCSGLTSITIPNSVTSIGESAFAGCSGLTSITIPNSVTSIGESAFSGCSSLDTIFCLANTPPTLSSNAFSGVPASTVIVVPCGRMMQYYSRWSNFSNFVESSPYSISATPANDAHGSVSYSSNSCTSYTLMAIPNSGFHFDHWNDNNSANPRTINLTQDTFLIAYFVPDAPSVVYIHDTTYINNFIHDTTYINNFIHDTTYIDNFIYDTTYINNFIHDTTYVDNFIHDTTYVDNFIHDTTYINNFIHDTTYIDNFIHDTTYINNFIHDTTYVDNFIHDTTYINNFIHDTTYIDNFIHDTTYIDNYIHDTTYIDNFIHDTTYIDLEYRTLTVISGNISRGIVAGNGSFPTGTQIEIAAIPISGNTFVSWQDGSTLNPRVVTLDDDMVFVATFDGTEGIDNTEPDPYAITSQGNQVIISGVAEFPVRIFDAVGRLLATSTSHSDTAVFSAPATGVYLIQVGTYPATRIVLR